MYTYKFLVLAIRVLVSLDSPNRSLFFELDQVDQVPSQVRQVCSFYIRRLVRLLPAFWLALLWRILMFLPLFLKLKSLKMS